MSFGDHANSNGWFSDLLGHIEILREARNAGFLREMNLADHECVAGYDRIVF